MRFPAGNQRHPIAQFHTGQQSIRREAGTRNPRPHLGKPRRRHPHQRRWFGWDADRRVRYDASVAHTVLRFLLAVLFAGSAVAGFEQALDRRLFGEAIAVGQSRIEAVRTRFHQPYRIQVSRPPIDYIDIVTPFRRVALLAEERAQAGGRLFQREAIALLGDRSTLVEILVEMTFHPLNVVRRGAGLQRRAHDGSVGSSDKSAGDRAYPAIRRAPRRGATAVTVRSGATPAGGESADARRHHRRDLRRRCAESEWRL